MHCAYLMTDQFLFSSLGLVVRDQWPVEARCQSSRQSLRLRKSKANENNFIDAGNGYAINGIITFMNGTRHRGESVWSSLLESVYVRIIKNRKTNESYH